MPGQDRRDLLVDSNPREVIVQVRSVADAAVGRLFPVALFFHGLAGDGKARVEKVGGTFAFQ